MYFRGNTEVSYGGTGGGSAKDLGVIWGGKIGQIQGFKVKIELSQTQVVWLYVQIMSGLKNCVQIMSGLKNCVRTMPGLKNFVRTM